MQVCFGSVHEGARQVYVVDVSRCALTADVPHAIIPIIPISLSGT